MIDKTRSISMLVFSLAGLIAAVAALVFVLRSSDARADAGGGARYQLTTTDNGNQVTFHVLDTTTGYIWEKPPGEMWHPLSPQFSPAKR
jgi:hypothetical protein